MDDTGITKVVWSDTIDGPASVNVATGVLYLNRRTWHKIPPNQRNFILLHEIGHRKLKTFDETAADNFAIAAYKSMGYPASAAVKAHLSQLDPNNPEHIQRANHVYKQLQTNNNTNNMRALATINEKNNYAANFLGFGKAARDRREARREDRQQARLDRINARQQGRAAQAAAGGGWQTAVSNIVGSLGGALGLGSGQQIGQNSDNTPPPSSGSGKTFMYVGIAIAVIVVIYFATKGKK